jgi:LmbE family N-acetylglucosaminyl deacetylase
VSAPVPVEAVGTLLGVWAHPDDEAYLSAGLMAAYRRRGDRVAVVTATLGEHGTTDPSRWPPKRLAARRHAELRNSLAVLDVDELYVLGYEDGTCAEHDGRDAIAEIMTAVEPDLVVTFGPDGMTGHPDHRAVSRWATDARAAARPDAQLWYSAVTAEFHRRWGAVNDRVAFFSYVDVPPCTAPSDLTASTRLPDDLLELKVAALGAHRSQTQPLVDLLGPVTYREWWRTESFRGVEARTPCGSRVGSAVR